MWRQGDVFLAGVASLPEGASPRAGGVLVEGELTGHSHRLEKAGVGEVLEHRGTLYLRVTARQATIVHQEHGLITLPRGSYRVWQQREYTPQAVRTVAD